ncbi:MAG: response regulator transcription factor [Acidobacteria bacterium]|nr:response regulator transcription factor [Acidobacteriota bacterium]
MVYPSRDILNTLEDTDLSSNLWQQQPVRVLIVDDSPLARDAIRLLLQSQQEVEVVGFAADGEEAVAQAEALSPDLILMDIQMPKLDGLRATQRIRDLFPVIRVIIVTVNHGAEVYQTCISCGAHGFIVKDRLYQDLFAEIQRVFSSRSP